MVHHSLSNIVSHSVDFLPDPSSQESFRPKNLTSLHIYGPEAQKPHHLIPENEDKLIQLLSNDRLSGLKELALNNLFDNDCCVTDKFVSNLGCKMSSFLPHSGGSLIDIALSFAPPAKIYLRMESFSLVSTSMNFWQNYFSKLPGIY